MWKARKFFSSPPSIARLHSMPLERLPDAPWHGSGPKPINLLSGWPNPGLLPPDQLLESAKLVLTDKSASTSALLYGPDEGSWQLREAIAKWLTGFYRPEETITTDRICVTGGASQNLAITLEVVTDAVYTRNIWMVSPTYFMACRIIDDAGFAGKLRAVPEDEEGVNVDFLAEAIRKSEESALAAGNLTPKLKTPRSTRHIYKHIIYCVPTFANPSGRIMTLTRREQLVRIARQYDALIITDDVYDMLAWSSNTNPEASTGSVNSAVLPRIVDVDRSMSPVPSEDSFGNAMSNGSFAKIVAPGCRTGWAEAAPKLAYGISQAGASRSGGCPSHLTSNFIHGMLSSGKLESHIYNILQPAYARRWRKLVRAVEEHLLPLGVTIVQTKGKLEETVAGGYFLYLTLPSSLIAEEVRLKAAENGLRILSGPQVRVEGDSSENDKYQHDVRLSFAWEEEDMLEVGIRKLATVIKSMLQ